MKSLTRYFLIALLALTSTPAFSQVSISVGIAPPPLVAYSQPAAPDDGYIWTPGYWAYGPDGYYWVPGCWVEPPQFGLFWTPGYWGWGGSGYFFHGGYWGNHVGFYGGVNYGYGYSGNGYGGGRWEGRHFAYNTAVNNVPGNFHYRYADSTVINNNTRNISYNGGNGGIQARPTAQERQFASERHIQPTSLQQAQVRAASRDRAQLASLNGGQPATTVAATPKAYQRIAQQHAKTQPISGQDRAQAQRLTSSINRTAGSSTHASTSLGPTHAATTHEPETHNLAPAHHAQTHVAETHAVSHPQASAAVHTQAHTQFHAQSHAQAHVQAHAPSHSGGGDGGDRKKH